MHPTFIRLTVLAVTCVVSMPIYAQETRASVSEAQRAEKAEQTATSPTTEAKPGTFDRLVSLGTRVAGKTGSAANGVFPIFGGPVPGSGIAAGSGLRYGVGSSATVDASMSLSLRRYAEAQATIRSSSIEGRSSIAAQVIAQDLPQLNYYGIGADSRKSDHSNYGIERFGALAFGTVRATRALSVDWRGGYTEVRLRPGTSDITPSIEQRFGAAAAPGLDETMGYVHGDGAVSVDWRDRPGYPTQGGVFRAGVSRFQSLAGDGSFSQLDVDTAHYLPIFRRNFDLVVRGHVTLSQPDAGSQVPFYMLPTLGGSETLRGFSDFRFRDRDAAVMNVEYRWPVFRMMDAALFADAGRVAPTPGALLNSALHRDYGMGVRLHTPTRAIARIDVAKGNEGIRLSLSLSAPLKSTHSVAPYVP